jgi:hypothetical protein
MFKYIHHKHNTIKHLFLNEVIFVDHVKSKKNIVDLLTKILIEKLVYSSSRRTILKSLKENEYQDGNPTSLTRYPKI